MFATMFNSLFAGEQTRKKSKKGNPGMLVNMSNLVGGRQSASTARQAMTEAHKSQMVWFRWGWILTSRYMVINELQLEKP
jgi:N-acetylglucosaminylphosphatidylinositol deacetylase